MVYLDDLDKFNNVSELDSFLKSEPEIVIPGAPGLRMKTLKMHVSEVNIDLIKRSYLLKNSSKYDRDVDFDDCRKLYVHLLNNMRLETQKPFLRNLLDKFHNKFIVSNKLKMVMDCVNSVQEERAAICYATYNRELLKDFAEHMTKLSK